VAKEGRTRVISLPEKEALKTINIKAKSALLSYDGRYLVLYGTRADGTSDSNVFVYDLLSDEKWETRIEVEIFDNEDFIWPVIHLTKDGKHMMTYSDKERKVSYYQLY
jgi:hypothetical protein